MRCVVMELLPRNRGAVWNGPAARLSGGSPGHGQPRRTGRSGLSGPGRAPRFGAREFERADRAWGRPQTRDVVVRAVRPRWLVEPAGVAADLAVGEPAVSSMTRKLVQPLVAQYSRLAVAARRRIRRIEQARYATAFVVARESIVEVFLSGLRRVWDGVPCRSNGRDIRRPERRSWARCGGRLRGVGVGLAAASIGRYTEIMRANGVLSNPPVGAGPSSPWTASARCAATASGG